jgi:hypothetical protein
LYAAEKNINVTMELYGAKGSDNGTRKGGQGGVSVISFIMKKNEEYVITRIPKLGENGGLFLYRKSTLLAVCGSGGNAGTGAPGGAGGGVAIAGGNGGGNGGNGGRLITLTDNINGNVFGSTASSSTKLLPKDTIASAPNGGQTIPCSKGPYWTQQGFSPCADVGPAGPNNPPAPVKFYRPDGSVIGNTATITRGFKAGYSILTTAGLGINGGGNGGGGATGGNGGGNAASSGGGGSGYLNSTSDVKLSPIQGRNDGAAKVVIYLTPAPVTTGNVITQLTNSDPVIILASVTGLAIFSEVFGTPTPAEVERYYQIKISKNVSASDIKITNIGKYTVAEGVEDLGITLRAGAAGISKISETGNTSTFKITFVRGPGPNFGYTTFVNTFDISI